MSGQTIRAGQAVRKRKSRLPWLLWLFGVGSIVIWWLLYHSSYFLIENVKVIGIHRLDKTTVMRLVHVNVGEPLMSVDSDAISKALVAIPQIKRVSVERGWPHSVLIRVVERAPVAVEATHPGFNLIDDEGMLAGHVNRQPPAMRIVTAKVNTPAMKSAVQIALALPINWKTKLIQATTTDSVVVELASGQHIVFGSGEQAVLKVKVAKALLLNKYHRINVSSPLSPTVRN